MRLAPVGDVELASGPQDSKHLAERALLVLTIEMVQHERREDAIKAAVSIRERPRHSRRDLQSKILAGRFRCRDPENLQIAIHTVDGSVRGTLVYQEHQRPGSTSQIQNPIVRFDPGELNEASLESPLRHRPANEWIVEPIQPSIAERGDVALPRHRRRFYGIPLTNPSAPARRRNRRMVPRIMA